MKFRELITQDKALSRRLSLYSSNRLVHGVAWVVARTGDSIFWLIVSAVLIYVQWPDAWSLLITVAVTALLTAVAKGLFKRQRPVEKWAIATDIYSFPSGHAARAGAVAVALSLALPPYTPLFFLWALLVAIARVMLSRHYVSDVAGGLIFGILVGLLLQGLLQLFF